MMRCCCLLAGALFLGLIQLISADTCPASGIPGLPGFPGFPGRDGRDGEKGEKGQPAFYRGGSTMKGEKGEPGLAGIAGKRGASGDPGYAGIPGLPGYPGEPGDSGAGGVRQRAAFSVARGTNEYPERSSVIRFTTVITNINGDYNTETGRFRCRVPGTYYFVFHASLDKRLCVQMNLGQQVLALFCDHRNTRKQVTAGGLAVYVAKDEEVWLESKTYVGMRGSPAGYSIFSGFLLQS